MVRSAKAIDRLLIILPLAHFFFLVLFDILLPLGDAIRRFRAVLCFFDFAHLKLVILNVVAPTF